MSDAIIELFDVYSLRAGRTRNPHMSHQDRMISSALGAAGEAGEIANKVKKVFYHGHPLNQGEIADEIGDVLWYLDDLARALGTSLERIAFMNIEKLKARYPEGFTEQASRERVG